MWECLWNLLTRLSGNDEYCPQTWASDEKFDKLDTLVKLDRLDKLDTLVKLDMVDERGSEEWIREAAELAAAAVFDQKNFSSSNEQILCRNSRII